MKEISKAMSEAFVEIEGAVKDKMNPYFNSMYADLGNVINAVKPALAKHGLWFIQTVHNQPGFAAVETIILHSSGDSLSCGITSVPVSKNDAQGYGSALTYARRYSLSAAFGVAPEDDDGNEACKTPEKKKEEVRKVESSEFPNLSQETMMNKDQIKALAKKVADVLHLEIDPVVNFLTMWQNKGSPLFPRVEYLLTNKKEELLKSFGRWQEKQST
jgi:hypothetical protein